MMEVMPEATTYINTDGKISLHPGVRLMYFWHTLCPESLRALHAAEQLYQHYRGHGLQVVGVHVPQFSLQTRAHVEAFVDDAPMSHTIIIDDGSLAKRHRVMRQPMCHLFDAGGRRHVERRECVDSHEIEQGIRYHLKLQGARHFPNVLYKHAYKEAPMRTVFLNYKQGRFNNDHIELGHVRRYRKPTRQKHTPSLEGQWCIDADRLTSHGGSLWLPVHAGQVHLVAQASQPADITVLQNGEPIDRLNAGDALVIDERQSYLSVGDVRVQQVWLSDEVQDHQLELRVPAGVELYSVVLGEGVV